MLNELMLLVEDIVRSPLYSFALLKKHPRTRLGTRNLFWMSGALSGCFNFDLNNMEIYHTEEPDFSGQGQKVTSHRELLALAGEISGVVQGIHDDLSLGLISLEELTSNASLEITFIIAVDIVCAKSLQLHMPEKSYVQGEILYWYHAPEGFYYIVDPKEKMLYRSEVPSLGKQAVIQDDNQIVELGDIIREHMVAELDKFSAPRVFQPATIFSLS